MSKIRKALAVMALSLAPLAAAAPAHGEGSGVTPPPAGTAAARGLDFRVPGVIIWATPLQPSTRLGLGSPGQGFEMISNGGPWDYYTCDNGVTTNFWLYGRNLATNVVGYVPDCNLVG
ncbi:hypothetical protein [Streptomyces cinereospinus]|uniref:SH3 domain-containing protein n=1 Tax=Streptomyces cinereospinus TaxID=285561 RepID=A0ABV5N0X8_9ACTN